MRSHFLREIDIKVAVLVYVLGDILVMALPSTAASLALHWIATAVLMIHIARYSSLRTPISAHGRILPLFIYGLIASIILSVNNSSSSSSSRRDDERLVTTSGKLSIGIIGIIVNILTAIVIYIFPLPCTPALDGKYARIGTHTFIIQSSREMTVQCWFPVVDGDDDRNILVSMVEWLFCCQQNKALLWTSGHPLHQDEESKKLFDALSSLNSVPSIAFNHMRIARTNSEWRDEIELNVLSKDEEEGQSSRKYPIAIYSHGLYGWRQIHHTVCEQLASNGFIVFAMDHHPDATITRPHLNVHNSTLFNFNFDESQDDDYGPVYRDFYMKGMERRANDIVELLDHLSGIQKFKSHLDLEKVYVWGHSYGGGTSGLLAAVDSRIAGVCMLDSWMFPMPDSARSLGTNAPVLALSSELWEGTKIQAPFRNDYLSHSRGKYAGNDFVVKGTDHQNFCDVIHLTSRILLTRPSSIGPNVDPNAIGEAMDRLVVCYFACLAYSTTFLKSCEKLRTVKNEHGGDDNNNSHCDNNNNNSFHDSGSDHSHMPITTHIRPKTSIAEDFINCMCTSRQGISKDILGKHRNAILSDDVKSMLLNHLMNARDVSHCYDTKRLQLVSSPSFYEPKIKINVE